MPYLVPVLCALKDKHRQPHGPYKSRFGNKQQTPLSRGWVTWAFKPLYIGRTESQDNWTYLLVFDHSFAQFLAKPGTISSDLSSLFNDHKSLASKGLR